MNWRTPPGHPGWNLTGFVANLLGVLAPVQIAVARLAVERGGEQLRADNGKSYIVIAAYPGLK